MSMLEKTNGHAAEPVTMAWDTRMARVERRIGELGEASEQRVRAAVDAVGDYLANELAGRDEEIGVLKRQVADLERLVEQKTGVDQQVHEIAMRLEERLGRRDSNKNGITDGFMQTMGMRITQERQSARAEFKAANEEMQHALDAKLTTLEERLKAVPGKLPVAKIWCAESVTYEAQVVCYDGALYQARKDTAQCPGGSDWICVARAGRDGCDGRTPNICGEYDAHQTYAQLDVVVFDGASFIARRDNPGDCPGDGWQLLSRQGRPGRRGETGLTGPRGEKGQQRRARRTRRDDRWLENRSPDLSRFSSSGRWTIGTGAEFARTFRAVPVRDKLAAFRADADCCAPWANQGVGVA